MSQHQHALNVECPQCHHVFDVEASLSQQIEKRLKADLAKGQSKALEELDKQREEIAKQKQDLAKQQLTIQQQVDFRLKQRTQEIKAEALKEAQQSQVEEFQALREKAEEQSQQLSALKKE